MTRPSHPWRRPVVYRSAIGLYVVLVLVLAGVSFAISAIDVQGALYLRGEVDLEKDRPHSMRGVFSYAPTGEVLVPDEMEWFLTPLEDEDRHYPLEFLDGPADPTWPNPTFILSDDITPGEHALHVETSHERVSQLSADEVVTVHDGRTPPSSISELQWWYASTARDDEASRRSSVVERVEVEERTRQDVALSVVPSDGELVRGLPQTLHLRTYHPETGHPVPATLTFKLTGGLLEDELVESVRSNRQGIASVDIRAATSPTMEVTVEPAPRHIVYPDEDLDPDEDEDSDDGHDRQLATEVFKLNLPTVPTQYALSPSSRVITAGDDIEAVVRSVFGDGYFMVDLYDYDENRLLDTLSLKMSDGAGGVRFPAPPTEGASPLLRLQAYQSIYGTRHGWDSAYVVLLDDDSEQTLRETVVDLFGWIAEHSDSPHHRALITEDHLDDLSQAQLRKLLEVGLDELPRTFELPPVLMNTRERDRRDLDIWRAEVQEDLRWMMGLTLFVGILVVLYFVIIGIRRNAREAAVLRELELESFDPPEKAQRRAELLERWTVALQGLIVFLTLLVFAVGILIMVSYL